MSKKQSNKGNPLLSWSRKASLHAVAACGLLLGAGMLQSCEKEILTGQPEWLGNSIYERLQEGITVSDGSKKTFNTTLRLIDDLGYKQTLSKTGSKTLFATPDDVYEAWFKEKGITLDNMTLAQKKQLFNNSMINNAYLLELMSNVSGNPPEEGMCMRRESSASIYDSIPSITLQEMPDNPLGDSKMDAWVQRRASGKTVPIFKDDTSAPMIHFLPVFMQTANITDNDLKVISNGESNSIADSWINGKKVISSEQTCKNGYIYVIDGVIDGTQSMAEIINNDPRTTLWSSFIKRWSVPYPVTGSALREYQALYGLSPQDSVFSLRYFNSGASTSRALTGGPESLLSFMDVSLPETNTLLFDPGWNQYIYDAAGDLHYDAGVMIVPTDEALNEWWNNGGGVAFKERYGTMDNLPYATLAQLLRVNMKESFIDAVPSKFGTVLDDENKPLGIEEGHIVESVMGCNGVVYIVNKVFAPVKYRSVIGPLLMQGSGDGALTIMYNVSNGTYPDASFINGVQDVTKDFTSYLNSTDSKYAIVTPYNTAPSVDPKHPNRKVFRYLDPCSYGLTQQNLFEFYYENEVIKAAVYKCRIDAETGTISVDATKSFDVKPDVIANRLYNLMDNNIIVGEITATPTYYTTKGGAIMKAYTEGDNAVFEGGFQLENNTKVTVVKDDIFQMENGKTYCPGVAEGGASAEINVPLTASKSVYQILKEEAAKEGSQCKLFFKMLTENPTTTALLKNNDAGYKCVNPSENYNMTLFDSYNYTVYIPTDAAIQKLIDAGSLPTWSDYKGDRSKQDTIVAERILNFLKYHIQDRAVCIGGAPVSGEQFESGLLDEETKRFYTYSVTSNANDLVVEDNSGNKRNVVKTTGLWNRISREYWIGGNPGATSATISSTSDAVVHQIDDVLFYDENEQRKPWNTSKP